MNWPDERYVRVYTRDTTDWQALSFEAQALQVMLLRKADRCGIIELGRHGKRGAIIAIGHGALWARLEPALDELLADGCLQINGDRLVFPNYIEAQTCRASDKLRQQEVRERRRDESLAGGVSGQNVTNRDDESQNVTKRHPVSPDVTPSHSVLSRTVLGRTEGEERPAAPPPASFGTTAEEEDLAVYEVFRSTFPETEPSMMPSFEVRGAIRDRRKRGATVEQCTKAIKGARMLFDEEPNKMFVKHMRQLQHVVNEKNWGPCIARFNDGPKRQGKPENTATMNTALKNADEHKRMRAELEAIRQRKEANEQA